MKKRSPRPLSRISLVSALREVVPEGELPKLEQLLRLERRLCKDGRKSSPKRRMVSALIKFMDAIPKNPIAGACWIWPKASKAIYPRITFPGEHVAVHRLSHFIYKGDPYPLLVCHKCDTPYCFNPDHLFLGTSADNIRDRDAKGRTSTGERHYYANLTEAQVIEILSENKTWEWGLMNRLASRYNVSRGTMQGILYGRTWKHLHARGYVPCIQAAPQFMHSSGKTYEYRPRKCHKQRMAAQEEKK